MIHATPTPIEPVAGDSGSIAASDPDPFHIVGTIVDGRYLVERVVGTGGFAIVYRARHLRFDSPVALKVLHRSLRQNRGRQEEFAQRLIAEGKFLFDLAPLHSSFVRVFEMGSITTADGTVAPYLALEWLEGATLKDEAHRLRRRGLRLDLTQVLSLFNGIAGGLSIAHRRLIAHRDIKPANIFLGLRDGQLRPRILDFGLAKAMSRSELGMDVFGDSQFVPTPFTPAYGAPEQWQRRLGATGAWTDVHALALLCVELLAGKPPLRGSDSAQLMTACLDPNVRPTPRALGVDLSNAVEAVFAQALSIDPRARHRDARAFWRALCLAAKVTDPERQLPRLTLPLLGELGDEPSGLDANDDQATAGSMTAASLVDAAERSSSGLEVTARLRRAGVRTTRLTVVAVAALLLCGLLLSVFVPAWAALTPRSNVTPPPIEPQTILVPPSLPPAVLAESLVSRAPFAQPPKLANVKQPPRAPIPRSTSSTSLPAALAPAAGTPPRATPQASASFAEPTAQPAPRVESAQPASTRGFDASGAELSGAQLDRLMLEDSLTRRK